jgi:hypothetical protein
LSPAELGDEYNMALRRFTNESDSDYALRIKLKSNLQGETIVSVNHTGDGGLRKVTFIAENGRSVDLCGTPDRLREMFSFVTDNADTPKVAAKTFEPRKFILRPRELEPVLVK